MNPLAEAYRDRVHGIMVQLCALQTAVSIVAAVLILILTAFAEPYLKNAGILLTLLSIPSVAYIGKRRLDEYERSGWKRQFPQYDFSGRWNVVCKPMCTTVEIDHSRPQGTVTGVVEITQTALGIRAVTGSLRGAVGMDDCTWEAISTHLNEKGDLVWVYEMKWNLRPDGAHKGVEILKREPDRFVDGANRKSLRGDFWDCVDDQCVPYRGITEYRSSTIAA